MSLRSIRLSALLLLIISLVVTCAGADTVNEQGVIVTLSTPENVYAAGSSIPATLIVNNHSSLPISDVTMRILPTEGYQLDEGFLEPVVIPLMNYGDERSITVVHLMQPSLPQTGDESHFFLYTLLTLTSAAGMIWLSLSGKKGRRVMGVVLCLACAGTALITVEPAKADDGFSLDPARWPEKPAVFSRRLSRGVTQTVNVTHTVSVDGKAVTLRAIVSFTFPSASDNLNDEVVDRGDLEMLEAQGTIDVSYDEDGQPAFINGAFVTQKVTSCQDAAAVLDAAAGLFSSDFDAEQGEITQTLLVDAQQREENFFRYSPTIRGIGVLGSQIVLAADGNGTVVSLTNGYDKRIDSVNTTPSITKSTATLRAMEAFLQEETTQPLLAWMKHKRPDETDASVREALLSMLDWEAKLLIYAAGKERDVALVYAVDVSTPSAEGETKTSTEEASVLPCYARTYYIYANGSRAGQVHSVINNQMEWSAQTITCKDNTETVRTINVQEQNGVYRLIDSVRSIETCRIETIYLPIYLPGQSNKFMLGRFAFPGPIVESTDFFGTRMNKEAVSLHANMEKTYDYYLNNLNRKSYDNRGARIVSSMDWWFDCYAEDADKDNRWVYNKNAAWSRYYQQFAFGNGKDYQDCLDIVAHEFTHAVTEKVNGLIYEQPESGALNEAYSDIMGNLVEGKSDSGRWLLGETADITSRDMSDPSRFEQPEHYDNFVEEGDVHTNSGIINFAAYKMMTDSRTRGVSDAQWAQVFYDSMHRLTNNSGFLHMRNAVICSAMKNGFDNSKQSAIKDAFDAVGVKEPQAIRIVLRWGSEPGDLDSHLTGPGVVNPSNRFHVYYSNQTYYNNGTYSSNSETCAVDLDYDDTTSFGPEVTTIHKLTPGRYYFFVHDFTNGRKADSPALAKSGATVEIILPNGTVHMYTVNPNSQGTIWDVCQIDIDSAGKVTLTELNRYGVQTSCE